MTQEDKQLLLVDLCARLPYGAKVYYKTAGWEDKNYTLSPQVIGNFLIRRDVVVKPYLRLMSSMTEDEIIEFNNIPSTKNYTIIENDLPWDVAHYKQIDWLNKKMFDFRGLIPKGLALSTEIYNPYIQ